MTKLWLSQRHIHWLCIGWGAYLLQIYASLLRNYKSTTNKSDFFPTTPKVDSQLPMALPSGYYKIQSTTSGGYVKGFTKKGQEVDMALPNTGDSEAQVILLSISSRLVHSPHVSDFSCRKGRQRLCCVWRSYRCWAWSQPSPIFLCCIPLTVQYSIRRLMMSLLLCGVAQVESSTGLSTNRPPRLLMILTKTTCLCWTIPLCMPTDNAFLKNTHKRQVLVWQKWHWIRPYGTLQILLQILSWSAYLEKFRCSCKRRK